MRSGGHSEKKAAINPTRKKSMLKIVFTNADVLTSHKMQELKILIAQDKPDIIAISEVKPKNFERVRTQAEYKLENYDMELLNVFSKEVGRGLILHVHES